MIESDQEAKAIVQKEEQQADTSDQEEEEYQDRETESYKKFQLDYERNKSVNSFFNYYPASSIEQ